MKATYFFAAGLAVPLFAAPAGAQEIHVQVNGRPVPFTGARPAQVQGRLLVPLRGVLEQMGASLVWDPATRTVIGSRGDRRFELPIGSSSAVVNGRSMPLDVPAQIVRGTTMVPLRFVSEALGAQVRWRGETQTVMIATDPLMAEDLEPARTGDEDTAFRDRDRGLRDGDAEEDDVANRSAIAARRRRERLRNRDVEDSDVGRTRPSRRRPAPASRNRDLEEDDFGRDVATDINPDTSTAQSSASGAGPVIQSFSHSVNGPVRAGSAIEVRMDGTPGGRAYFDVVGVASNVPMTETQSGHYTGRVTVPQGLNVQNARVFGRLVANGRQAPIIQAGNPITIDAQPPQILNLTPAPGTVVTRARPDIYAELRSQGEAGIDPDSVRLTVNGRDVTRDARITSGFIFYEPTQDLNGDASVELRVSDRAGNVKTASTRFQVRPQAEGLAAVSHTAEKPLTPGEVLTVTAKGEPGGQAMLQLPGVADGIRMAETAPGVYTATYTVRATDQAADVPVTVRFAPRTGPASRLVAAQPVTIASGKPPMRPLLLGPKPGTVQTGTITVTGRSEPGTMVRVTLSTSGRLFGVLPISGSNIVQEVKTGANGIFTSDPLPLPNPTGAKDLRYMIEVVATDALGRVSKPLTAEYRAR